jgi:alpha-1,2-mannosyltransferase
MRRMDAALPFRSRLELRQRWFLLGLLAFFLILNVQYVVKVQFSQRESRSAFVRWSGQLEELQDGKNIWKRHNYPNPPIMALILLPFAQLPTGAGALAWFYGKVVLTVLAIQWVFNLLDRPERPFPLWGKMLALLLSLRPIQGDLTHGNVNLFILFLVVACIVAFSRRRDGLAGLALALAIACKVTPALFVPYFLWKRAWKTLAATALGLCLFLLLIPGLSFGWQKNLTYLQSWHQVMVHPFVVEGTVTSEHQNQSLPGLMARLLTDSPSFATYEGDRYVPVEYHNLASLERGHLRWAVKGCIGVFALLVLWRCRTPIDERMNWKLLAEFSIVALGMLLFSERTWKHHAVTLLLPFAVLCYVLSAFELSRPRRRYVIGTLTLASLLILSTSTGFWDTHDLIGKTAQVYGAYVWAFVLLTASMFVLLGWQVVVQKVSPRAAARGLESSVESNCSG